MVKIVALSLFLSSCYPIKDNWNSIAPVMEKLFHKNERQIKCRITYYCGMDKWGSRTADPKTKKAIKGITVAAHPDFKFGQKIHIPQLKGVIGNGDFIVQDRGSAVTKKRASKNKTYVFDVFVSSPAEIRKMSRQNPEYMTVYIK
jgi:hypothetical protein